MPETFETALKARTDAMLDACTRCGKCVQVCPTGALFDKSKIGSDHPKYPDFLPYLNLMREAQ